MTAYQMGQLIGYGLVLAVPFVIGLVIGWAIADGSYKKKLFAKSQTMKAEARNELLWEMQNARQAPPADGPVYRA